MSVQPNGIDSLCGTGSRVVVVVDVVFGLEKKAFQPRKRSTHKNVRCVVRRMFGARIEMDRTKSAQSAFCVDYQLYNEPQLLRC